jgi:hypothetical protein
MNSSGRKKYLIVVARRIQGAALVGRRSLSDEVAGDI